MSVPYFKPYNVTHDNYRKITLGSCRAVGSLNFLLLHPVYTGSFLPWIPYPIPSAWVALQPPGLHSNNREDSLQTLSKVTFPHQSLAPKS